MVEPRRISPFVGRKLRALDSELASAIPRVLDATDDEAIHDLRVAIRRLRTLLKLVRPVYGRFHADAVRRAFTDVQRATGDLRDEEVLEETLDQALPHAEYPSYRAWRARRRVRERHLRRAVVARLRTGDLARARNLLRALLTLPVMPKRDRNLGKFARKCVERARAGVDKKRDVETDDAEGLHELRIAYKELRYAAELLEGALPADIAALAEPAARFQKRLGELHDVDVAIVVARRARALDAEAQTALLTHLAELRQKRVHKYVAEMTPAAPEAEPSRDDAARAVAIARARGARQVTP